MDIPHEIVGLDRQLWNCDKPACSDPRTTDTHRGTLYVDSAHDGLSPLLSAPSNYEDVMFDNTLQLSSDPEPISKHPEYFEEINIDDNAPNFGYYPESNACYIIDVIRKGTYLKGLNQFLDSASTGHTGEFIEGCMNKFMSPTTTYKDITGIEKTKVGDLFLFKFYDSSLNVPNQNRFDYTAYTNYDILIFFHAMKKIGINFESSTANMNIFNDFLNKSISDAAKNREIQKNKFIIINAIGLNYLWQNLMTYCNNLTDNGDYDTYKKHSTSLLRHIIFVNFNIEPSKNTQYAKYCIGYIDSLDVSVDINHLNSLDLLDSVAVKNFIITVAKKIYYTARGGLTIDTSIEPLDCPRVDQEYTFYTSQSMCCSEMQKTKPSNKLDNRNPEAGNANRDSMLLGIDELFNTCTSFGVTSPGKDIKDFKLYFYRLLKFQGDSSHLVFSKIIDNAKNTSLIFNGSYSLAVGKTITMEKIIITGERPLYCRAIQESLSIRSKKFVKYKQILGSNDKGTKTVQNNADPCEYYKSIYEKLNKICNKNVYDTALGNYTGEVKTFTLTIFSGKKNAVQIQKEADEKIIKECVKFCENMYEPFIKYYENNIGEENTTDGIKKIIKEMTDPLPPTTTSENCKTKLTELQQKNNGEIDINVNDIDEHGTVTPKSIKIPKNYQYYFDLYNEFINFKYIITDISILLPSIIELGKINISGAYGKNAKLILKSASNSFMYLTNLFNYNSNIDCSTNLFPTTVPIIGLFNNSEFNKITDDTFKENSIKLFCKTKELIDKVKDLIVSIHKDCFITQFPERIFITYNKEWLVDSNNKKIKTLKEVIYKPLWYYEYSILDEENQAKQSYIDLIRRSVRVKFTQSSNSDDNLNIDQVAIDTYTELILYFYDKCNDFPNSINGDKLDKLNEDQYKKFNKLINKNLDNFKLIDITCEILKCIADIPDIESINSLNNAINNVKLIFNKFIDAQKITDDVDTEIGYTSDIKTKIDEALALITKNFPPTPTTPNKKITDASLYNEIYSAISTKITEIKTPITTPPPNITIKGIEININKIITNKINLCHSLSIIYNLFYHTFYFINHKNDSGNIDIMDQYMNDIKNKIQERITCYYKDVTPPTDLNLKKQHSIDKKNKSLIIHILNDKGKIVAEKLNLTGVITNAVGGQICNEASKKLDANQQNIYNSLIELKKLIHNQTSLWADATRSIPVFIRNVLNTTEYFYIDFNNTIQKFDSKLVGLPVKGGSNELVKYTGGADPRQQKKIDKILNEFKSCISFFNPDNIKRKILKSNIDINMILDGDKFNIEERIQPTDYTKFREIRELSHEDERKNYQDETINWMEKVFYAINRLEYDTPQGKVNILINGKIYTKDDTNIDWYTARINAMKLYIIAFNVQIQQFIDQYFKRIKFLIFGFTTLETLFGLIELIDDNTIQYIKDKINDTTDNALITNDFIKEFLINIIENKRNARNFLDNMELISIFCNDIKITNKGQFLIILNIIQCIVNKTYIPNYYNISENEITQFINNLYKLYNTDEYEIENNTANAEAITDVDNYNKKRKQIIDGLKYIYSDYQIRQFLNMKVKHYNIVEFIFGVKYIVQDPYSYTVKQLYDEVIKNYNRVRMINTTANIGDKIKGLNIDIPSFLKIHFSQYQILRLLLSFDLNYHTLEESVFESWEEIVLSDITSDSVVGDFLIPNKEVPYLDKLDHKYSSALSNQAIQGDSSFANFVNCFKNEKTSKIKYKYCSTIDFVLSMFKRCNLFITNDEEEVYNDIKIDELYGLYKVLTLNSDICNKLVEKM